MVSWYVFIPLASAYKQIRTHVRTYCLLLVIPEYVESKALRQLLIAPVNKDTKSLPVNAYNQQFPAILEGYICYILST